MKRIVNNLTLLILSAILLMPWQRALAADEPVNYFGEAGVTWISRLSNSHPDFSDVYYRKWTGDMVEIDGYSARPFWIETLYSDTCEAPRLSSYLRIDGGKVYFLKDEESAEWKLMYDFTLSPGEEAEISDYSGNTPWFSGRVRCMNIHPLESNPELQVMELTFCEELENIDESVNSDEQRYSLIQWIIGVGNIGGPMDNLYSDGIVGWGCSLEEMMVGDTLIYRSPYYTGVEEVSDADMVEIKVMKGEIMVGGNPASISAYSVDGVRCYGREGRFCDLTPGVYVVSIDGKSRKVVVP